MGHLPENHSQNPDESRIAELAGAYADALIAGDEIAAEIAIREAMDADLDTADIDERVIAPALWLIGELWERGKLSIAEEHIATEITVRVLALQREAQRVADGSVRGAGYEVVMSGGDAAPLAAAAAHHKPDVLSQLDDAGPQG